MLAPGSDSGRLKVKQGAEITGYVFDVKVGGIETTNCGARAVEGRDTHIEPVLDPRAGAASQRVIVEVTPRWRAMMALKVWTGRRGHYATDWWVNGSRSKVGCYTTWSTSMNPRTPLPVVGGTGERPLGRFKRAHRLRLYRDLRNRDSPSLVLAVTCACRIALLQGRRCQQDSPRWCRYGLVFTPWVTFGLTPASVVQYPAPRWAHRG